MMPQFLPESKESSNAICAKLKNPDFSNDEVILPENQTIVLQIEGTNSNKLISRNILQIFHFFKLTVFQ